MAIADRTSVMTMSAATTNMTACVRRFPGIGLPVVLELERHGLVKFAEAGDDPLEFIPTLP